MTSRFSILPFPLALALGVLCLAALPIFNVSQRGVGIVALHPKRLRYAAREIARQLATLRERFLALFTWRHCLTALAILAIVLSSHHDAGAAPVLIGMVGAPGMPDLAKVAQASLGRNQGPEFFASTPHTGVVSQVLIPKNVSLTRPLEAFIFRWRGRVVIAGANYTAVAAESPQTIINRIIVQGTWKGQALTPISMSGATAYAWTRCFGIRGSSSFIATGGGATTRQAEPNIPFTQTLANFGNTGTYDLDIFYVIPVWPIISKSNRAQNIVPYLWQQADWSDSLQITLQLGDLTSFGTPAGMTTATFTGFGSGAGSPVVEIYTRYQILGSLRSGFRTACVIRNENTITAGVTALGTNVRILQLQKQKMTNIMVKSGLILAGTTSGVQVVSALSDVMLERTQVLNDNKPVRNNLSNFTSKESIGYQFTTIEPQGYLPFSFIDSQNVRSAYRGDLPSVVGSGADFALYTDVIAANAQNAIFPIQEMIFADPDDPYWAGTR